MRPKNYFQKFTSVEASGGFWLFLATFIAILWSNSPFSTQYTAFTQTFFTIETNQFTHNFSLSFLVNEGLMTLFFFLIGLEVKRELQVGELNTVKKAILPAAAALGGMVIPACIYIAFNWHDPIGMRGWAIPTPTDIAFSLAVLSLLGTRIPLSLKIFLTALAIFDDLGAVLIIAIFYAQKIIWSGIALVGILEVVLILCNLFEIALPIIYFSIGALMWWLLFISGIHPTLAGVLVALTVPLRLHKKPWNKPLPRLEQALHPWVTFLILPFFALINAGVSFQGFFENLLTAISLGIALGLFLGKPLGVLSFCWIATKSRIAHFPSGVNWRNLIGISSLCGIGFTMSFFIGFLSFDSHSIAHQSYLRSGILCGSLLSGILGYAWLYKYKSFFKISTISKKP